MLAYQMEFEPQRHVKNNLSAYWMPHRLFTQSYNEVSGPSVEPIGFSIKI